MKNEPSRGVRRSPTTRLHSIIANLPARRAGVILLHVALWTASFGLALWLRFDGAVPPAIAHACRLTLVLLVAFRLATFAYWRLFDGLWRYTGLPELRRLVLASTAGSFIAFAVEMLFTHQGTPRSVYLGNWLASIVLIGGMRMVMRTIYERARGDSDGAPLLVIGAGDAGESLIRELKRMRDGKVWKVAGFLDDDRSKWGRRIHDSPVLGPADEETLRASVKKHSIELVVLAIPSAGGERTRELVQLCRRIGVRAKTVLSLAERMSGDAPGTIRELNIEDLLGRDPVKLDLGQLNGFLEGKVVLVTGAGGSIGSELARQVLRFKPRQLLLLDHDENAIFFLERELQELAGSAGVLKPLIVDITNERRVSWVFKAFRPDVVLHAAAHKHVAMMEANACEAAWNNVFGTQTIAEAAHAAGTCAFVMISTDKAVNPTSVMGATKRVCEMLIQRIAARSSTRFTSVRFGNVLGSNGSVVPLFREQIARGGPVLVTHPEVTRYFMTIPEAAQLVLQTGALAGMGEVFLLDMGKPVKILDLAHDLIELSGLRPGEDIQIEFTGLKSGEKLFEEMLLDSESSNARPHPQIVVGNVEPVRPDFPHGMIALGQAIRLHDDGALRRALGALVPEAMLAPGHTLALLPGESHTSQLGHHTFHLVGAEEQSSAPGASPLAKGTRRVGGD